MITLQKLNSDLYISLMKLNEICEVYSGYAIKEFNNIKKGLPVIKIGNILTDGTLNLGECKFSTEDINEKYHSKKGDIYVALSGATTGKLGIMEDEKKYIINQRVGIIRLKQKSVSQSYIKFFLLKQTERIIDEATGCAQPNISPKQIGEYDVPVFSEKEMLQISDILNNIVCVIKHYKAMIKKYDDLIKARFIEMFGDPVSNSKHLPLKTLPQLGTFGRGVSKYRPRNAPELLNGPYPLIQTGDIANSELYIKNYNNTYSEVGLKQSKMWDKGTLCITIAANIAKTAILQFDACFPDSVVGFNGNNLTDNIFVHYWFSFFQEILENQAPESAQKNINLKILSELQIITPDIIEQNQFADFVRQVDKSREAVKKSLEKTQQLYDSLMQEYFG